jgi:hypothetical protein
MSIFDKIFVFILVLSHVDRILAAACFEVVDHRCSQLLGVQGDWCGMILYASVYGDGVLCFFLFPRYISNCICIVPYPSFIVEERARVFFS